MRMISNHVEDYGNTPVEQWLTAFYTGKNLEKLDPDGILYRFHLSHNDLDGLACHVVSTVYDCALNRFEIPLTDVTDALQYKNWEEIHDAHHRTPIRHSICEAGAKNVKEALHEIFEACCRSVFYKPVSPKDQIILLITDLGGITDSMFDEFYEAYGDRFQAIVIDHHLATTPDRGKCDPNQIFWYVTGYQEGNLQSATKNLFTVTYDPDASNIAVSEKQKTFMKQLTEYVEAVSKYDTGRWGEWLGRSTPDNVDPSVQHQLFFNHLSWDTVNVIHRTMIQNYVEDMIRLLCMEDYVHTYLYQYARSGATGEKLAVLMGKQLVLDGKETVFISGVVQARFTEKLKGMETITGQSWKYISEEIEKYFAGLEVVGWMHSRPSFGAFVTSRDEAYHKKVFGGKNQVFFVVDPADRQDRFYVLNENKTALRPVKGYFVYYDKNTQMQEYMLQNSLVHPKNAVDEDEDDVRGT